MVKYGRVISKSFKTSIEKILSETDIRTNLKNKSLELIKKITTFFSDNYSSHHVFHINEANLNYMTNIELLWLGGIRPTEEKITEDAQYSSAIISQTGEMENIQVNDPKKSIQRTVYNGNTDWVAIRSKYFI